MVFTYANGQEVDCVFPCAMLQGYTTMTACEHFCSRYYRCDNIAMADNEIKEWGIAFTFLLSFRPVYSRNCWKLYKIGV